MFSPTIVNIFVNDISDHLPIFAVILGYKHAFGDRNRYITFCLKNQQNTPRIKPELGNVNWTEFPGYNDPYLAYRSFLEKHIAIYNQCFPLEMVMAKGYTTSKLWLSKALLKSIRGKKVLYKRFFDNPIPQREYRYKRCKNKLSHSLRTAKRQYYAKRMEEAKLM